VGATRPCLPIVRAVFAALADPAGVTAHRPGALEREQAEPSGAVQAARHDLAGQLAGDLCRIDAQRRATKAKVAAAIRASGTTVTEVSGAGPVIAATVIGDVRDISRFASQDHFAAYNGTAPVEVPSGNRTVHRLPPRGNRCLNHAIHMTAITQIAHRHSTGRAYYEKKLAEGKTAKEALRALKRQVSDAIYKSLKSDAASTGTDVQGPGGHPGNDTVASAAGSHPEHRLFGQATPGPAPTLRPRPRTQKKPTARSRRKPSRTA